MRMEVFECHFVNVALAAKIQKIYQKNTFRGVK